MEITRIEYDLITKGFDRWEISYRRFLDGTWEIEQFSDASWADEWEPVSPEDADRLEAEYQQVIGDQMRNLAMKNNEGLE